MYSNFLKCRTQVQRVVKPKKEAFHFPSDKKNVLAFS